MDAPERQRYAQGEQTEGDRYCDPDGQAESVRHFERLVPVGDRQTRPRDEHEEPCFASSAEKGHHGDDRYLLAVGPHHPQDLAPVASLKDTP